MGGKLLSVVCCLLLVLITLVSSQGKRHKRLFEIFGRQKIIEVRSTCFLDVGQIALPFDEHNHPSFYASAIFTTNSRCSHRDFTLTRHVSRCRRRSQRRRVPRGEDVRGVHRGGAQVRLVHTGGEFSDGFTLEGTCRATISESVGAALIHGGGRADIFFQLG